MTTMALKSTWQSAMGLTAAAVIAACGVATFSPAMAMQPADKAKEKLDYSKAEKRDSIIFTNGNKVEGIIIEETDASVKFLVIVGTLRSEATYNKADILDIKRNEFAPAAKDESKPDATKPAETPAIANVTPTNSNNTYANPVDTAGKVISPGTLKVYVAKMTGEFGRDVSKTPVKAMMDDIANAKPDVIVFEFNQAFSFQGEEAGADFVQMGGEGFLTTAIVKAQEIDTLITPRLRDDPAFAHKPKVVAWIKKALGPAAFNPLAFPNIYFASDGYQGGVGGLDHLLDGRGDEVVRQKQYSLRLAWVKGLAEQGGHDSRIARAMCWGNYILSYRVVGGQVEFLENEMPPSPEWYLLKDDGPENKDRADNVQDVIRMKGNDFLTLDAKTAFNIGYSKGTADTLEDLLGQMGITRDFAELKTKSPQIYKEWSTEVARTEREVQKLLRAYRAVAVKPPGQYEQRTAARGQRKAILRQVQSAVQLYKEALSPRAIGDPEGLINQLDILIDRIETEQRLDRRP